MHKLPCVSILFCILRTIYRLCMRNSIELIKLRNYRYKYKNKSHLRKLGFVIAFFVKPGLNLWPFYTVMDLVVCSVMFYLHNAKVYLKPCSQL